MMDLGKAIGTACATFAITNIDDLFVLVTFFAEASTSKVLTPLKITIGQYVGFTAIIIVSMIGFGAAFLLPTEPIGFLGLLPILLGIWWLFGVVFPGDEEDESETLTSSAAEEPPATGVFSIIGMKSILKVASITVMNGADNVGTYVPLFSQAKGGEIAVYVVVYYILLGIWCLAAFLFMKQKHVLRVAQKYARVVVPFLYMGLGVFIIVESDCYPWSTERIDDDIATGDPTNPGEIILAVLTVVLLLICMGLMAWIKLRSKPHPAQAQAEAEIDPSPNYDEGTGSNPESLARRCSTAEPASPERRENQGAEPDLGHAKS